MARASGPPLSGTMTSGVPDAGPAFRLMSRPAETQGRFVTGSLMRDVVTIALSGAIDGIIGQNIGAGRPDRVEEAYWAATKLCAVYMPVAGALMALATKPIARLFGLSDAGTEVVRTFAYFAAGSFIFTGALFVPNATFNNLGKPVWSMAANWFRDGLLVWSFALAGAACAAAPGILWANAIVNVIDGAMAAWRA